VGRLRPLVAFPQVFGLVSFFCLRLAYPLQSTTPAFNQDLIKRLMVGNVFSLLQQCIVADAVEAFGNVSIQYIFRFLTIVWRVLPQSHHDMSVLVGSRSY
jgi:hypothetical protein